MQRPTFELAALRLRLKSPEMCSGLRRPHEEKGAQDRFADCLIIRIENTAHVCVQYHNAKIGEGRRAPVFLVAEGGVP